MGRSVVSLNASVRTSGKKSHVPTKHRTDPALAAIEVFTRNGFETTTVDEIADAAQISRSTFFRRFGSKEDVVFADQEVLFARAEAHLRASGSDPLLAIADVARLVFDHQVANPEVSMARFELLSAVKSLRDREIVNAHRYQELFERFLLSALPDSPDRTLTAASFAASIVATHNAVMRNWLTDQDASHRHTLDTQLRRLCALFASNRGSSKGPIIVAVFDADTEASEIAAAVRASLA